MNKLFLIGNGFDLALGLKTSYKDFLLWLIQKYINEAYNTTYAPFPKYHDFEEAGNEKICKKVNGYFENEIIEIMIKKGHKYGTYQESVFQNIEEILKLRKEGILTINFLNSDGIMNTIFKDSEFNWVDIESIYFDLIKRYYIQQYSTDTVIQKVEFIKKVKLINKELTFIAAELKCYLEEIQRSTKHKINKKHNENFKAAVYTKSIEKEEEYEWLFPERTYFLNFNYTSTLLKYDVDQVNYIHGSIESEIVFGYGDEMDKIYKEIEELNDNEVFQHIKSFHYFKRPDFRQLLAFLDSKKFQACIYGHSCGISDRVLLNEIFEHPNCESIRIYHRDELDYFNKSMNISRHFNSNKILRRKIINYNEEDLIPQLK